MGGGERAVLELDVRAVFGHLRELRVRKGRRKRGRSRPDLDDFKEAPHFTSLTLSVSLAAPPKRAHQGPDRHTKPPGERVFTSGGHRARGSGHVRGAKTPAFGAERRQFERKSGGNPDSQKKVDQGWGPNEGEAELSGESSRVDAARAAMLIDGLS